MDNMKIGDLIGWKYVDRGTKKEKIKYGLLIGYYAGDPILDFDYQRAYVSVDHYNKHKRYRMYIRDTNLDLKYINGTIHNPPIISTLRQNKERNIEPPNDDRPDVPLFLRILSYCFARKSRGT